MSKAEIDGFITEKFRDVKTGLVYRVLSQSYGSAVRGEVVFIPYSSLADRGIDQAWRMGMVEVIQDGGPCIRSLASVGPCPTPQKHNPANRVYMKGYAGIVNPEAQQYADKLLDGPKTYHASPRTLDALLPDRPMGGQKRSWIEAPEVWVRPNLSYVIPTQFGAIELWDQRDMQLNAFLATREAAKRTRHGEPALVILGELPSTFEPALYF